MKLDNVKIGTLIKAFDSIFQYAGYRMLAIVATSDKGLRVFKGNVDIPYLEYLYESTFKGEITTVFDCGIDPKALPIKEPIDVTGWVVTEGYKFEPLSFTDKYAENGWHQLYEWEDCKPCLNPNK